MEKTPKKVEKPGLQLVVSVLVAAAFILTELYVMINQPANVVLVIGIAVLVLLAVYFVIDAVIDCEKQKEIALKEQYDNIYRSERASYKLLKKKMEEFAELVETMNTGNQTENNDDIIKSQKSLAKLTVNKNRESAEMLAAKIAQLEKTLEGELASVKLSGVDEEKQERLFIEINNLEASLSDRLQGLSYKLAGFQEEIERLADHIAKINSEAIQTAVNTASHHLEASAKELEKEIVLLEDIPAIEVTDDIEFTDLNMDGITFAEESDSFGMGAFADEDEELVEEFLDADSAEENELDDILAELEKAVEEIPEPVKEPIPVEEPTPVEEKKPTPPPADNGGKMNQDDIAALIASMTGGAPAEEPAPEPVEEKKPTPPPADNGGKMNQDDIAALIASMTGN